MKFNRYLPELIKEKAKKIVGTPKPEPPIPTTPRTSEYILLPGRNHGSYSYPDLLVGMQREYQGSNWNEAHTHLHSTNYFMLNLRQTADLLHDLHTGTLYDETGTQLSSSIVQELLNDMIQVRDPWRAEWIDAQFQKKGELWTISYDHRTKNGILTPERIETLEACMMQDQFPGIDLQNWIQKATIQGMPATTTTNGSMYYWGPKDNTVAGLDANSYGVSLYCDRDPPNSYSALGVRKARLK